MSVDILRERLQARRELPPPDVLRDLRVKAGVSLEQVGEAVGVTGAAVFHWERGRSRPRAEHLAAYLQVIQLLREVTA
jgi:transcriptional regulator with XRE-family HTH domain